MFQKAILVQRMAELQAQISRHEFSGVGTLIAGKEESDEEERLGEVVSGMFFWGSHFDYDIPRGPFRSSHDWLAAYLEFVIQDQIASQEKAKADEDEEDEEDAKFALELARRLASLLPKIFPSIQNPAERTVIWHEDLSLNNILVDDEGNITAIIDWECVSAMPRWRSARMPKFLAGPSRENEPKRQEYADEDPGESEAFEAVEDDVLDNEGKDELYWIHLMEYEKTQLRKFYEARIRQIQPDWDATAKESILKDDFFGAVTRCGGGFYLKRITQWVHAVEQGEFPRLMDILEAGLRL
jgi:hypothetical protein